MEHCANCQRCVEAAYKWWSAQPEGSRRANAWHLGGLVGTYLAYGGGLRARLGLFASGLTDLLCREHATAALEALQARCRSDLSHKREDVKPRCIGPDSFVFVTQNLWNPNYGGCGPNPAARLEMFACFAGSHQADVVNVQELCEGVVVNIKLDEFESDLAKIGLTHQASPRMERAQGSMNIVRQYSGLALYGRFPLLKEPCWRRFTAQNRAGVISSKGFLHCVFQIAGCAVHVFNVHLCNDRQDVRVQQLQELRPCVQTVMEQHVIVAGDLNICPQHLWDRGESYGTLVDFMQSLNLDSACCTCGPHAADAPATYPQDGATYDHVFFTKGKFELLHVGDCKSAGASVMDASVNPAELRVSDHLAIVCRFKIKSSFE